MLRSIKPLWLLIVLAFCFNLNAQQKAVNAFYYASGIVVDSKGNLFVTGKNNKIIKITPDGSAFHFPGHPKGYTQNKDGKGTGATFAQISGIAIDDEDNLFIADYTTIKKVTPEGVVTTIYGSPNKGAVKDGNRNTVTFYRLGSIAVDDNGTLYVTDQIFDSVQKRTFDIIRKVSPSGNVHTIKNRDGSLFRSHNIEGLTCDNIGNLYVSAMAWSSAIIKISPDEIITSVTGVYDEYVKNRAYFKEDDAKPISPVGIAINQHGELFFSDRCLGRILKLENNKVITVAGGGGKSASGANLMGGCGSGGYADGKGRQALLNGPQGIAFDKTGNLYIVDGTTSNNYVRKLSVDGMVTTFCKQDYNPVTKQYEDNLQRENRNLVGADKKNQTETKNEIINTSLQNQIDDITTKAKSLADSILQAGNSVPNPVAEKEIGSLPAIDSARIRSIPNKTFSIIELNSYLNNLHTQISKILPAGAVSSAQAIAKKLGNDPQKLEGAAVIAWGNGAWEESLWLITNASCNSSSGRLLTNTGAILDMVGLSEKAVPVLRTIVRLDPGNAIAHNNLGQAFTALGMRDSALHYFSRCLSYSPQHPEANNTAGYIELKKGNKDKAQIHFENSIRGSFNHPAYNGLLSIKKDAKITKLVRPKVKIPEYFNELKYKLPRQCTSVDIAEQVRKEHQEFKKMISDLKDKYGKLRKEFEQRFATQGMEKIKNKARQGKQVVRPFLPLGYIMGLETTAAYGEEIGDLQKFDKDIKRQYKELEKQYETEHANAMNEFGGNCCTGEANATCCPKFEEVCRASEKIKNMYLPKFARLIEEKQSRFLLIERKYFDDLVYWNYLSSFDENDFGRRFYGLVVNHLDVLYRLCETKILEPCNRKESKEIGKEEDTTTVKLPDCPFSFSIRLWVAKIDGDCEKISFKAGQGIVLRYERNFRLRQSTYSIGIGADIDQARGKDMNIEYGIESEATMAVYLTYDRGGNFSDGGMIYKLKGKASVGFESGQKLNFKDGMSWQFGINSGITFEPGPLAKLLEPVPEVQRNKKVKIYQPH